MVHDPSASSETVHRVLEGVLLVYRLGGACGDACGEDCLGTQSVVEEERLMELSQAPVDLRGGSAWHDRVKEESASCCIDIGGIQSRDGKMGRRGVSGLRDGVGKESIEWLEARVGREAETETEDVDFGKGSWHGR
jgi:hypothetical protein